MSNIITFLSNWQVLLLFINYYLLLLIGWEIKYTATITNNLSYFSCIFKIDNFMICLAYIGYYIFSPFLSQNKAEYIFYNLVVYLLPSVINAIN